MVRRGRGVSKGVLIKCLGKVFKCFCDYNLGVRVRVHAIYELGVVHYSLFSWGGF